MRRACRTEAVRQRRSAQTSLSLRPRRTSPLDLACPGPRFIIWDQSTRWCPLKRWQLSNRLYKTWWKMAVHSVVKLSCRMVIFIKFCRSSTMQLAVKSRLLSAPLWWLFRTIHLTQNIDAAENEIRSAQCLLDLGNGTLPRVQGGRSELSVRLSDDCVSDNVMTDPFGQWHKVSDVPKWALRLVNEGVLSRLEDEMKSYHSIDSI